MCGLEYYISKDTRLVRICADMDWNKSYPTSGTLLTTISVTQGENWEAYSSASLRKDISFRLLKVFIWGSLVRLGPSWLIMDFNCIFVDNTLNLVTWLSKGQLYPKIGELLYDIHLVIQERQNECPQSNVTGSVMSSKQMWQVQSCKIWVFIFVEFVCKSVRLLWSFILICSGVGIYPKHHTLPIPPRSRLFSSHVLN